MASSGNTPTPKKAAKHSFKPIVSICLILIFLFAVGSKSKEKAAQREAEAWDRKALATATVALDTYAPDTDYGPITTTGWTVIHRQDGVTVVWAPRVYGLICVLMTDDGEDYTPYYISVDGTVKLGTFGEDPPSF